MASSTKLKDLFSPKEEAAFSLLDQLDLEEESMSTELLGEPQVPHHQISHVQSPTTDIAINPERALFFPQLSNKRDAYDLIKEKRWYWRDRRVRFWKTESDEEIKKKWETSKGELTRSWKQRWRRRKRMDDL